MADTAIQIRLPAEMHEFLKLRSALTGRSIAHEVRRMIEVFQAGDDLTAVKLVKVGGDFHIRSAATLEILSSYRVRAVAENAVAKAQALAPDLKVVGAA